MNKKCNPVTHSMAYNEAFQGAGVMGRAQLLVITTGFLIMFCGGWQSLLTVFAARDVNFYCAVKSTYRNDVTLVEVNETNDVRTNEVLFGSFRNDVTTNGTTGFITGSKNDVMNNSTNAVVIAEAHCLHECLEYVYESRVSSIIKEFDLDCGPKKHLKQFVHSPYWLGYLVSNIFVGQLGDKYGRRPICLVSVCLQGLTLLASYFSPNIEFLFVIRFINGLLNGGSYALAYLIVVECSHERYLSKLALSSQAMYTLGPIFAASFGYIFKFSWKLQFLTLAVVVITSFFAAIFFLPESPRWYFTKGKVDEAEKVIKWFEKMNGKTTKTSLKKSREPQLPDDEEKSCQNEALNENTAEKNEIFDKMTESTETAWIFILCKTFRGALFLFTHLLLWTACSFIYFGINFEAQEMHSNMYVCSILLSLCELPALLLYKFVDKIGHKTTVIIGLSLGTVACLVIPFTEAFAGATYKVAFAIFAKLMINIAYNCLYICTPASFPTILRSTAMNSCFVAQNVAATIAAVLCETKFGPYNCGSFVIYGTLGLLSLVFILLFGKETTGIALFNTVKEYHRFVKT